jgi:hypothetical protein
MGQAGGQRSIQFNPHTAVLNQYAQESIKFI